MPGRFESSNIEETSTPEDEPHNEAFIADNTTQAAIQAAIGNEHLARIRNMTGNYLTPDMVHPDLASMVNPARLGSVDHEDPSFKGTSQDLCSFIATAIFWYERQNLAGPSLWAKFRDHFEDWDETMWANTPRRALKTLATILCDRGVFIPEKTRESITNILTQQRFHVWSQAETDAYKQESPNFGFRMQNPHFRREITVERDLWTTTPVRSSVGTSIPTIRTASPVQPLGATEGGDNYGPPPTNSAETL